MDKILSLVSLRASSITLTILLAVILVFGQGSTIVEANKHEPTENCFVLDGVFSNCPSSGDEWADVAGIPFPETGAVLRATQVAFDPGGSGVLTHLALNYDEVGRQTPLGDDEFALVHWETVINDALVHVSARIFNDGTIMLFRDGIAVEDPPGTVRATAIQHHEGSAGFGPSFDSPASHLIYELVVPLKGAVLSHVLGTPYSPAPQHWGSVVLPGLDHFKCYRGDPLSSDGPSNISVDLRDQFGFDEDVPVGPVLRFCNPVEKIHDNVVTPIQDQGAHLKLYQIPADPSFQQRPVTVSNQFGDSQLLEVIQPLFLAVPTHKLLVDLNPASDPNDEDLVPTGLGPPIALDHFKCYEVDPEQPVNTPVDLKDQFHLEPGVLVMHAALLCNPVEKTHDGQVFKPRNPQDHLVCYRIPEDEFSARVVATNQFGKETLDIDSASLLCVPSQKFTDDGPPRSAGLDHFKCYRVGQDDPVGETVFLRDQFGQGNADVRVATEFCNPVEKTHHDPNGTSTVTPIQDQGAHLKLYQITADTPFEQRQVIVSNQFGDVQLLGVIEPLFLAVPTHKLLVNLDPAGDELVPTGLGPPISLDHFKCYSVFGEPVNARVNLLDQFHLEEDVDVAEPFLLCNPVEKTHNNEVFPPQSPEAHLVCYTIPNDAFPARVVANNQFGEETLDILKPSLLCVPSEKFTLGDDGLLPGNDLPPNGVLGDFDNNFIANFRPQSPNLLVSQVTDPPADFDGDGVPDFDDNCPLISNPGQEDTDLNGIGDACEDLLGGFSTAAFLQSSPDGNTFAEVTDTDFGAVSLEEKLVRIVDFFVDFLGLDPNDTNDLIQSLVDSQLGLGLVGEEEANDLKGDVLGTVLGGSGHFLSYDVKITKDTPKFVKRTVTLTDQFETELIFEVKKVKGLYNPADNDGGGIDDPDTHLVGYDIKRPKGAPKHDKVMGIKVINQFGSLFVDTNKPDRLLVPSLKNSNVPIPVVFPDGFPSDHFKCYSVKVSKGNKFPKGRQVVVVDQFNQPALYDVKKPKRLCNPVLKDETVGAGETLEDLLINSELHLMCYDIKPPKGDKHVKELGIELLNQFHPEIPLLVDTKKEKELCLPSQKIAPVP